MSMSDLEPLASDCSQGRVASRRILSKGPISGHEPVPPARVHGGLLNGRGTAEQWIREGKCLVFNLSGRGGDARSGTARVQGPSHGGLHRPGLAERTDLTASNADRAAQTTSSQSPGHRICEGQAELTPAFCGNWATHRLKNFGPNHATRIVTTIGTGHGRPEADLWHPVCFVVVGVEVSR